MNNATTPDLLGNLEKYRIGVQAKVDAYCKEQNITYIPGYVVKIKTGKRYIKVGRCPISWNADRTAPLMSNGEIVTTGFEIHSFIDTTNGDVLKPASWSMPAKHARGNIYDESNGLARVSYFGPEYLR